MRSICALKQVSSVTHPAVRWSENLKSENCKSLHASNLHSYASSCIIPQSVFKQHGPRHRSLISARPANRADAIRFKKWRRTGWICMNYRPFEVATAPRRNIQVWDFPVLAYLSACKLEDHSLATAQNETVPGSFSRKGITCRECKGKKSLDVLSEKRFQPETLDLNDKEIKHI